MRYNEMYLNRIRELSALIFEICLYDLNMKDIDFIDKVINSSLINDLSNADVDIIGRSSIELIYELLNIKINKNNYLYRDEYWIGFNIAYLSWYYNKSFKEVLSEVNLNEFRKLYITYHEMDERHLKDYLSTRLGVKSKLKEMRLKRRLSQSQLAYLSNVNVRNIKTYEQNENDINKAQVNILLSLARVLNCSIEDILD
jgi:DNA-binding XRE family transcriptional regulator